MNCRSTKLLRFQFFSKHLLNYYNNHINGMIIIKYAIILYIQTEHINNQCIN